MNHALNLIPTTYHRDCNLIARGYGISPQFAPLLLLEAAGTALGSSLTLRSPEYRRPRGSFDLVVISGEPSAVRAALFALLGFVFQSMEAALDLRIAGSLKDAQADLEARISARDASAAELRKIESQLNALEAEHGRTMQREFKVPADGVLNITDPSVRAAMEAAALKLGFPKEKAALEMLIKDMRREMGKWDASITDARMSPAPFVIREDTPWNQLSRAGEGSFDGAVLNVVSGQLLRHLPRTERRRLSELATLFHQSQVGMLPGSAEATTTSLSNLICCDPETFAQILSDRDVMDARVFAGFLFAEDDDGAAPDGDAIIDYFQTNTCAARIEELFRQRLALSRRAIGLDVDGYREFSAFRQWCRTFRAQWPAVAPFFERWPDLALSLAQSSTALAGEHLTGLLPAQRLRAATAFLRSHAPAQAALLARATGLRSEADARHYQVQRLCQKLNGKGALSLRDIARLYDRQKYETILPWLEAAIEAGWVEKRGELFAAVAVSAVSASVEGKVVGFPEGVGA